MMKWIAALLAVCALGFTVPTTAFADEVTCESRNNQRAECEMDTRGEVRLVRQLSKTRCEEGVNWGLFKHSIWVDGGCRGVFASSGGGYGGGQSGDASTGTATRVTCESRNNQLAECDMNTRGEVRLVENLSSTRCQEGVNWGLNKHTVWVNDGCRGVFENVSAGGGGYDSSSNEPTTAQIRACNAVEDNYGEVVEYSALKPGAWEIILDYSDGRYVCNVERDNNVTYFEKLRR